MSRKTIENLKLKKLGKYLVSRQPIYSSNSGHVCKETVKTIYVHPDYDEVGYLAETETVCRINFVDGELSSIVSAKANYLVMERIS